MRFPLSIVFRRGAVFRHGRYDKLDDPKYAGGDTKAKYFVVLSTSHSNDPIFYLLTTSQERHRGKPWVFAIPNGIYDFLPAETFIDVNVAGTLEISSGHFAELYQTDQIEPKGHLTAADVRALVDLILACPTVEDNFKRTLSDPTR